MSKRVKLSVFGGVILVLAAIGGLTAAKSGKKAVEVRIEQVQGRDLVASVTASGQVRPQTKVDLSSDITGKIVKLAVKEGQMVTKGQFLLQIDAQQAEANVQRMQASLASSKAQMAQAQANLLQAQKSYERTAQIKKTNPTLISDEQMEQLRTAVDVNKALYESARHSVDQSNASLREASSSLGKTTIYAPMSGRVTRLNVENGETAIQGTLNKDAATLLTIADMSVLETKVKVDETDVARIALGDSAVIQIDAFPDTTFIGRVTKISNSAVKSATAQTTADQAVDYEVTIQLVNTPAETRPDFSATAKIITDTRKNVLSIPIIALTVRENEALTKGDTAVGLGKPKPKKEVGKKDVEGVFVVGKDNKVTFRPVRVGIAGEKHFEVLSGLKAGDKIVAGTYQAIRELKDGALVREQKAEPKKEQAKS
ncbi:MAG: efflux RND transporter periplasmic adaptor subunit [Gemmatimonadaceae bacterium]|nr:efflux RND transporter periplasmic adaptor subunit [Gemmatimonadaceae bacterium]NUO93349.1 efflux RND transporter periplasmic adaptor subunit [Gemmatimonadaceae bacterium]NUP69874.1 efflux RND transporter periplasmic adaptor subunit [Gemmatimonadaceae bacterium]NUR36292.1 efflux RND transporter periplasmic adaptor subunit [Gemmatimonadaceae bacterium]NUS33977.1 efflux RND transporter periplasmic adaptor subunit [Gemmatimonadaceae bacterium]